MSSKGEREAASDVASETTSDVASEAASDVARETTIDVASKAANVTSDTLSISSTENIYSHLFTNCH